ncbi:uncharacterized protein EAE98_001388 [Botrytis deweyae]|uniref:Nucleoporin NUP188 n=1 Tax=Botrytis deweyae TaxID=2478750 RepID=A0ABQ7J1J0_9HELO|nr:uncharacterized protein EAE98_001388 [Botrytis deweyae]KAF7939052.1 hypothetical protein EAE98_001388 [Botrytis deweyae]
MVPIPEASYFPELGRCLKGEEILISWETAFFALLNIQENGAQITLEKFFKDPKVLSLLSNPVTAFPEPTNETKEEFESKNAPINADHSSADYDVSKVSEDARWLSGMVKIDEVTALRLVVQEHQSRAYAQLLGKLSEEELISLQDAFGNKKSTNFLSAGSFIGTQAEVAPSEEESRRNRRMRMLSIYLSERRFFWKCLTLIIQRPRLSPTPITPLDDWYEGLHIKLLGSWKSSGASQNRMVELVKSIDAGLTKLFDAKSEGSGWSLEGDGRDELELEWASNQIIEATHMMETIFYYIFSSDTALEISHSDLVLEWFDFISKFKFLDEMGMLHPTLQAVALPLQTISAIITFAILNVDSCLIFLERPSKDLAPADLAEGPNKPWLLNQTAIIKLHQILTEAASANYITAGPAVLTWSVILKHIKVRVDLREKLQRRRHEGLSDNDEYNDEPLPIGSEPILAPDAYEGVLTTIKVTDELVDYLALSAVNDCRVFEVLANISRTLGDTYDAAFMPQLGSSLRIAILELMKASAPDVGYNAQTLQTVVSVMDGGQQYWDFVDLRNVESEFEPISYFVTDVGLVREFWQNASMRYPWEAPPFQTLVRSLAYLHDADGGVHESIFPLLDSRPTFTYLLPYQYADYETVQEEHNNNSIQLTRGLSMFEPRGRGISRRLLIDNGNQGQALVLAAANGDLQIPAGTPGVVIVENDPKVVHLTHHYRGMRYFGKLLETYLVAGEEYDATTGMGADSETVADIIGTFATGLLALSRSDKEAEQIQNDATEFFQVASSALNRNRDITLVISAVFEQELQRQSSESSSDASLDILISCIQYLHALLLFSPGRVWPLIGRSGLLSDGRGGSGKLASIVGRVEVISGRYSFLVSCTRLFEALVNDFAVNAIARNRKVTMAPARFSEVEEHNVRVADKVLSEVLLHFTRYLTEVLESSYTWQFDQPSDQLQLTKTIMSSFEKMLTYSFGIQGDPEELPQSDSRSKSDLGRDSKDHQDPAIPIMSALSPAAMHIVDSYLSKSSGPMRFGPILRTLFYGFNTRSTTMYTNRSLLVAGGVKAALKFSRQLLRISALLEKPSHLETQLFTAAPLIARLYAVNDSYRTPVIKLFEAMIVSASSSTSEPPSLLGYLGAKTSKNFLNVVSDLDTPLNRDENVGSIWHFLSMIMSSRQQWFANYVLTGKTPRDALKKKNPDVAKSSSPKPLLLTALDNLSQIGDIPDSEALMMLEFVSLAQNFWPWTMHELESSTGFINYLSNYISTLKPIQVSSKSEPAIKACYRTRIAAYIAEILAMHLFHSRQTGKPSIAKDLMPKLNYYYENAGGLPTYNASLHGNLKKNFDVKYARTSLQSFKKTDLEDRKFGENYFYDLQLLDQMLRSDVAWTGRRNDGYKFELASANINLSLVDAQVALLNAWKILAVELTSNITKESDHQETLIDAALKCLASNAQSPQTEKIFSRLLQTRADFALVACQRLIEANPRCPKMKNLLKIVWETVRTLDKSFAMAIATGDGPYYRLLLKILFLALRVHSEDNNVGDIDPRVSTRKQQLESESTADIYMIVDVIERVIAGGFSDLAHIIHDNHEESSPEDIALITGLLQACLRIPGIEFHHSQIVTIMANCKTPRIATTLFSWSDQIAINGDPIYGELSIIFLLELSSMPAMAEQLAVDGVLGQVSSASITTYLRRGNVSPFADGAGIQRCYNIWVRGILPLILNLLHSVGASIATEVAIFLNQFPHLLAQSAAAFDAPESSRTTSISAPKHLCLSTASEVHSLALIVYILNGFREQLQGIQVVPEVDWDLGAVAENVEFWLGSRAVLRERIVPMGDKDLDWRGKKIEAGKAGAMGCLDRLEEKVVFEMMGIRDVISGGDP